jgi:hypothetical protein
MPSLLMELSRSFEILNSFCSKKTARRQKRSAVATTLHAEPRASVHASVRSFRRYNLPQNRCYGLSRKIQNCLFLLDVFYIYSFLGPPYLVTSRFILFSSRFLSIALILKQRTACLFYSVGSILQSLPQSVCRL